MLLQTSAFTSTTGAGAINCGRFASNGLLSSVDMCYLLDCDNGFFGGLVDPCDDPSAGSWLLDCAGRTTTSTTTTDDDTDTDEE